MTANNTTGADMEAILANFLDGTLTPAEETALLSAMEKDPAFAVKVRALNRDKLVMQVLLDAPGSRSFVEETVVAAGYSEDRNLFSDKVARRLELQETTGTPATDGLHTGFHTWKTWLALAAAAALVAAFCWATIFLTERKRQEQQPPQIGKKGEKVPVGHGKEKQEEYLSEVVRLKGNVLVGTESRNMIDAKAGDRLVPGTLIRTGPGDSSCTLNLATGKVEIVLGNNSETILEGGGQTTVDGLTVQLLSGKVDSTVNQKGFKYTVRTEVGFARAAGTRFVVKFVKPERNVTKDEEGESEMKNGAMMIATVLSGIVLVGNPCGTNMATAGDEVIVKEGKAPMPGATHQTAVMGVVQKVDAEKMTIEIKYTKFSGERREGERKGTLTVMSVTCNADTKFVGTKLETMKAGDTVLITYAISDNVNLAKKVKAPNSVDPEGAGSGVPSKVPVGAGAGAGAGMNPFGAAPGSNPAKK